MEKAENKEGTKEKKIFYYTVDLYCRSEGRDTSISHWPKVVGNSENENTLSRIPIYCSKEGEDGELQEYFTKTPVSSKVGPGLTFVTAKAISKKEFAKGTEKLTEDDIRRIRNRVNAFIKTREIDFRGVKPVAASISQPKKK